MNSKHAFFCSFCFQFSQEGKPQSLFFPPLVENSRAPLCCCLAIAVYVIVPCSISGYWYPFRNKKLGFVALSLTCKVQCNSEAANSSCLIYKNKVFVTDKRRALAAFTGGGNKVNEWVKKQGCALVGCVHDRK